jgi:hypothetical protein
MKKVIYFLLFVNLQLAFAQQKAVFHSIIFAETDDAKIGRSVFQDYDKMLVELATMASANDMTLKEYHHIDAQSSKDNAIKVLNNLQVGSQDVVFFYYSGHGARATNDATKFPQIMLGHSDGEFLSLSNIDKMIQAKNPKLRIVMADCCNSILQGLSPKSLSGGVTHLKNNTTENYKNLISRLSGNIIVCSSSVGEPSAAYDDGGAFTTAFLTELQKILLTTQATWQVLLENTKVATFNRARHTPLFDIQVRTVNQPTPTPANTPTTIISTTGNSATYLNTFLSLADTRKGLSERIGMITGVLNQTFATPDAKVEIVGKNGQTLVHRERAEDFIKRLATLRNLVNLVEIEVQKDSNGKITAIKLHEIYKS